MTTYMVNATLTVMVWTEVEGDTEAEAVAAARDLRPQDFDMDIGGGTLEFNVDPIVCEIPF